VGSLNLPSTGTVYVDTQIVIYSVETHASYWPVRRPLWAGLQNLSFSVVSSELTLLEVLVAPIRAGDMVLTNAYYQLFRSRGIRLFSVSEPVLREAASLRATLRLRTPDAIHAATALIHRCTMFLTNDIVFRSVPGLPVVVLDDHLSP
jgi:predicted nucleic acid-binding protein